jgi:polyisoprenoid-binding protein YceI
MFKYPAVFALAGIVALGLPSKPASMGGAWQVDAGHSSAQLITDATTEYGKSKIDVTLGFARVNGQVAIDDNDLAKSSFDLRLYPATGMAPNINESGKFLTAWLSNMSNHTLVCFHSKGAVKTADGKLQTTGTLVLTRVDRSIDASPSEGYSGPVYGPPILHRVSHEATFVFDVPAVAKGQKDNSVALTGSTRMVREDFPQLVRAAVNTYWPVVVQDKSCQPAGEPTQAYSGAQCTGTMLDAPGLPAEPHAAGGEDVGISQGFNEIVGNRLTIVLNLRMGAENSAVAVNGGY